MTWIIMMYGKCIITLSVMILPLIVFLIVVETFKFMNIVQLFCMKKCWLIFLYIVRKNRVVNVCTFSCWTEDFCFFVNFLFVLDLRYNLFLPWCHDLLNSQIERLCLFTYIPILVTSSPVFCTMLTIPPLIHLGCSTRCVSFPVLYCHVDLNNVNAILRY